MRSQIPKGTDKTNPWSRGISTVQKTHLYRKDERDITRSDFEEIKRSVFGLRITYSEQVTVFWWRLGSFWDYIGWPRPSELQWEKKEDFLWKPMWQGSWESSSSRVCLRDRQSRSVLPYGKEVQVRVVLGERPTTLFRPPEIFLTE